MQSILVTGGAGFLGANFVHFLSAETDVQIINLDRLTYASNLDSLAPFQGNARHVFVEGDIGDRDLVRRLLGDYRVDAVVNFAAESHVDRSIEDKDSFRFLQVSTDEVYGSLVPTGRFTETIPYAPNSPYAASKAAADHLVRA